MLPSFAMFALAISAPIEPVVYVIGTLHRHHLEPKMGYSLAQLYAEIAALKPDVICGEISTEHFESAVEGIHPPEASFLAESAKALATAFVAADWRGNYAAAQAARKTVPPEKKAEIDAAGANFQAKWKNFSDHQFSDLCTRLRHKPRSGKCTRR